MALAVASTTNGTSTSSTTVVVTKPSGVASGDLLIIVGNSSAGSSFTCPGFTVGGDWAWDAPGGLGDPSVRLLYRIADSSDVSASNYTVTGATNQMGILSMLRITGWSTGNPVFGSAYEGWDPSSSGTRTITGLSIPRLSQSVVFLVTASYDDGDSDTIGNIRTQTLTSADSNPTWTEIIDSNVTVGGSGVGKMSLSVSHATTTSTATITGYSFQYDDQDADDAAGALSVLIVMNEPNSPTTDLSHNAVIPAQFGPTVTQVNTNPDLSHNAVVPTINGTETIAASPTMWTNGDKPSETTWTNTDK